MLIQVQVISLIVFLILIIFYLFYSKLEFYKFQLNNKQAEINSLKIELKKMIELEKYIDRLDKEKKYSNIKYQRQQTRNKVSNEEIHYIVNYSNFNYEIDMCHINALNTFIELGENASIMIGEASYMDNGKEKIVKNHLWNEYKYFDNDEKTQLIDSINYKEDGKKKYFNHRGVQLRLYDYMGDKTREVQQLIKEEKNNLLTTYANDDKNCVYRER